MHKSPLTFSYDDLSAKEKVPDSEDWEWKSLFRGLLWRLKLGVLPSLLPSIEELRQAAADSRRKYAELRRRLLVDPHAMEGGSHKSHPLNVDNPLSQDPDSVWSRHFQISELEETIDNDLSRLYPEHGDFFQSTFCQEMLRRILLVWSLMHPSCSYRQGMHELLAPLLYVLHSDVSFFSEVKQRYKDVFDDRFEEPFCLKVKAQENVRKQRSEALIWYKAITTFEDSRSQVDIGSLERITTQKCEILQVDEWNYCLRILVMGNDTYGAEGELGVLFSGRFVEHDAFSMFDALMCGKIGGVNMADYFLPPNSAGVSPALEASAFLYRALAVVDLPLHSHLKGLGVEPQFFALRWIRVLFGREFELQTLLTIWDALLLTVDFEESNRPNKDLIVCLDSPRRVFIIALALSMLLYLRLTLFAAPDATTCLQKLMNFPQTASVEVLLENARNLSPLVKETASNFAKAVQNMDTQKNGVLRQSSHKSLLHPQITKFSSDILQKSFPDFYWEEKWKTFVLREDAQMHCKNKLRTQCDPEPNQGSAFASGIDHLLGSRNTSTRDGNKETETTYVRAMRGSGEVSSFTGKFKDSLPSACGTTRNQEGGAKIEQTIFLVADNSNQGSLGSSRLEIIENSNAAAATRVPVSNSPQMLNSSDAYEPTDSNVLTTHGCHQILGCMEERDSLPGCLLTDKEPKPVLSTEHVAQVDAVPASASLSKAPLHPRKYWMWSFGKNRGHSKGVDKKVPSHQEARKEPIKAASVNANVSVDKVSLLGKEKPVSKSMESMPMNKYVNEQCSVYSSSIAGEKDQVMVDHACEAGENDTSPSITAFVEEGASHLTDLARLGQCMSKKIQVIETAFGQILASETKVGFTENLELCNELAKSPSKSNSTELAPKLVQVAIEELKNISNRLLQM